MTEMSAVKHGLFRRGFMMCDRCVLQARCKTFVPGGACGVEREAFDGLVAELTRQYRLEGLADQILVQRAAMCLIRIARAEVYEAHIGVSDQSAVWGKYIARLDNTLRALLKDLALTRSKRLETAEHDLYTDVAQLLKRLETTPKKVDPKLLGQVQAPMTMLLHEWTQQGKRLHASAEETQAVENAPDSEERR